MALNPARRNHEADRDRYLAELGTMASRIVHEIRNPLSAIRMQVAVIRSKLDQPDEGCLAIAREQLSLLEREVLRLEALAQAFLEFGRPPPDEPEYIDVIGLASDVVALLQPEMQADGLKLSLEADRFAAPPLVRMDRTRLRQVLHNLLDNARTATEAGGSIGLRITVSRAGQILLGVCDSGKGIPAEAQARIFEPFFSNTAGCGLGLSIVKRMVEVAGGEIRVTSEVGRGTEVWVALPAADTAGIADGTEVPKLTC